MNPPVVASVGTIGSGSGSNVIIPIPSGVVAGSLVVIYVFTSATNAMTFPAMMPETTAWKYGGGQLASINAGSYWISSAWYYHYATTTESGNYTIAMGVDNSSGSYLRVNAYAMRITGGPTANNPFVDSFQSASVVGGTTATVSTFTPGAANSLLLSGVFLDANATEGKPAAWTETVQSVNPGSNATLAIDYLAQTTVAATGSLAFTSSVSTNIGVLIGSIRFAAPTTSISNTFEGGTNNTGITSGNSGTGSGDPITSTAFNAGTTMQFSNDFAHRGTLSLRVSFAASSAGYAIFSFTPSAINARTVISCYVYIPSSTNANSTDLIVIRSSSTNVAGLAVNASGRLLLAAGSSSTQVWLSAAALPKNQWIQVVIAVTVGTTTSNGTVECAYYLNDSSTATDSSGLITGRNLGIVPMTTIRLGYAGNVGTPARSVYYDDFQCQELLAGFIGQTVGPLAIAGTADQPTISSGTLAASALHSTIIGASSVGYMREKRTGVAETAAGVNQTSTAALDLTGSSHYRYPGMHVDFLVATPSNPGQYMGTAFKPGSSATVQNARYLFPVEFVTNAPQVAIRLNAVVTNPRLGRVYVNGKPVSNSAITFTGTAGSGTEVVMTFPAAASRTILIIGFNNDEGRFGGVDVPAGYTVTKPTAPISDLLMYLGDSYMNGAGSNATTGANDVETWVWAVADALGISYVMSDAIGGTGYVTDTGGLTNRFSARAPDIAKVGPTRLILGGARNDSPATGVQAAAEALIDAANTAGVPKIYVTNSADDSQTAAIAAVRMACATRAKKYVGGFSISALPKIADNIHLTQAGHATFASNTATLILSPLKNFKLGSANPSALAIGSLDVSQIYKGSTLVWEK